MLPAALALVLLAALVLQLALPSQEELPPPAIAGGGVRATPPRISGGYAPDILTAAPIFAPNRTATASADGAGAPAGILGGARVAGSVSVGGRAYAVIQYPGGKIARLPVGGRLAGWRLAALSPEGARFARNAERVDLPFGALSPTMPDTGQQPEEEQ